MSTATTSSKPIARVAGAPVANRWQLFWLMLLLSVAPMMLPYLTNLWSREPYRYFPFCFLAVGWLTHLRWDREFRAPRGIASWIVIGLGVALTGFGIGIASPWICAIAFVTFAATFYFAIRDSNGRSLVGLALPLLMLINLPLGYDQLLTIRLQQLTTGLSSVMLDVLAIPHAVSNNVIQLTNRELFVAEACSGIQSVFTLMFLSTLLIAFNRRPIWLAPVYLAIAALLAVAANVIRVTVVAAGDVWMGIDLAEGWQHELVGYTALCIGVLFLLSFDHLVITLLHPVDPVVEGENNLLIRGWNFIVGDEHDGDPIATAPRSAIVDAGSDRGAQFWNSIWSRRVLGGLLGVLAVAGIAQAVNLRSSVQVFVRPTEVVYQPDSNVFDRPFESVIVTEHERTRGGSNPRLGENADIWLCAPKRVAAEIQVVLSQPYAGWHELCICYEINAWILLNREIRGSMDSDAETDLAKAKRTIPYAIARFKNSDGRFAYLIYSAVDEEGRIVRPPPRPGRLENRFTQYFEESAEATHSNLMMMQMFILPDEKLKAEALREFAADFVEMRSIIQTGVRQDSAIDPDDAESSNSPPSTSTGQEG